MKGVNKEVRATSCEMNDTTNKKQLHLSLQKPTQERFSSVTCKEIKEAAKGVVPANTKSSNKWAFKNLCAWVSDCNACMSDEAVLDDLHTCKDADTLCKWMCCFVQETHKENQRELPTNCTLNFDFS